MSVPATKQVVLIPGELQIDSSAGYKETNGLISFIGAFKTKLGQIRAYGFGAFQSMLMDSSNCSVGFEVRTTTNQGDPSLLGGKGDQFPLTIVSDLTKIKSLEVTQTPTSFKNQFAGDSIAKIVRQNTTAASSLTNSIFDIVQNQWKVGETMQVNLGASTFSGCSVWSYTLPTSTSSSADDNFSSLSMKRSNTVVENIRMFTTGNVSIPLRLDVGTINATTYLNLPPVPSSQLLPITLDAAQGRVGINQTTPAAALDVTGNGHFTGTLDVSDIAVGNSILVAGDATVVGTLDVRQDIDLNRNLNVLGDATIFRLGVIDSVSSYKYFSGSSFLVGGTGDPEGNVEGTPASIYMRSDTGDVYTKTGLGTTGWTKVGGDLSPITLDKTNNRVGINQTSPNAPLDVNGNIIAGWGTNSVAIGTDAGWLGGTQPKQKSNSVAIGASAGSLGQDIGSVAVGFFSGNTDQASGAVAIGNSAGQTSQGARAVAVGLNAGKTAQGSQAIALGYNAGTTNQHENSIILNANGTALNSDGTSRFYVKPIRENTAATTVLGYDSTTGEISYRFSPASGPQVWKLSVQNQPLTTTPAYYLAQELPAGKYIATIIIHCDNAGGMIRYTFKMIAGVPYAAEEVIFSGNGITHTMTACFDRSSAFNFLFECYQEQTTTSNVITLISTIMKLG